MGIPDAGNRLNSEDRSIRQRPLETACVAQLAERLISNQNVESSILSARTGANINCSDVSCKLAVGNDGDGWWLLTRDALDR